jgi:N-acetylmuramoyl-L-alanine amidase
LEKKGFTLVTLSQLIPAPPKKSANNPTRIGIDPGHGGIDSGTKRGVQAEKDLNLAFSKRLAKELRKKGYSVIFSRTADNLLTPYCHYLNQSRPYKHDDLERRLQKLQNFNAALIVSIHANWSTLPSRKGAVVFYSKNSPESVLLANNIQCDLNKTTGIRKTAKTGDYYLLNHAEIPAVIIELGYISNYEELKLLHTNSYQDRLINAIIIGLSKTCPP